MTQSERVSSDNDITVLVPESGRNYRRTRRVRGRRLHLPPRRNYGVDSTVLFSNHVGMPAYSSPGMGGAAGTLDRTR